MNISKVMQWPRFRQSIITQSYRCLSDKNTENQPSTSTNKLSANLTADRPKKIEGPPPEHPFSRTLKILNNDMKTARNFILPKKKIIHSNIQDDFSHKNIKIAPTDEFQTFCDVLIVGGGGVGSSIAFWLKKRGLDGLNVVVIEKDSTYERASTSLSVGGLRQQFSLEENILMGLYGADFLRNAKEHLDDDCALNFTPHGYLMLATEEGADTLNKNSILQNEMGAKNEILTAKQLKRKFPWINTDGIELGCHGLEKEGWFDPWALLMGFKRTARRLGAHYVDAEVVDFEFRKQPDITMEGVEAGSFEGLDAALVRMPDGEIRRIKFGICILAAGAYSGDVAKLARIGTGSGMLSIPLPVEPRKRYVYVFETQGDNYPGLNTPLTIDPTNVYFRRDGLGGNFLAGRSPTFEQEPSCDNFDVDYEYFDTDVWPTLAKRVPAFESVRVKNAWAGLYEYNTFDENGIIGSHPYYNNCLIATGFSGHGIQQTPAVGRAIAEIILDGEYRSIDLSRLCFDRIIVDQPMFEVNIV